MSTMNISKEEALLKAKTIAIERGGECLSDAYLTTNAPMHWRCKEGHEWHAPYKRVVTAGTWCYTCYHTKNKVMPTRLKIGLDSVIALQKAHSIARENGGLCLENEYKPTTAKYQWQCTKGHVWKADYHNVVVSKTWCPECKNGRTERMVKSLLEDLFNKPFKKIRPSWLQNPDTGKCLEIDMFNADLNLGVEYHGKQHYMPRFQHCENTTTLKYQQARDQFKKQCAHAHGIQLIEVPYNVRADELAWWIYGALYFRNNEHAQTLAALIEDRWETVQPRSFVDTEDHIQTIKAYADSRGGECLDSHYMGVNAKYTWRCSDGHQWKSIWANVSKTQSWCPYCDGQRLDKDNRIEKIRALAQSKGGILLSTYYINNRTKLLFQCADGHQWGATAASILCNDSWCPSCAGNQKAPDSQLQKAVVRAASMGGECLSTQYVNVDEKLKWRCKHGHEWEASHYSVVGKRQTWCPHCAGKLKSAEEQLRLANDYAIEKGGECLSTEYINTKHKLKWRCKAGHEWMADLEHMHGRNKWCSTCKATSTDGATP